jgi:hypothetical protein
MLEALPDNDVRYAIIDIFYETSEGSRAEIFFISWYMTSNGANERAILCMFV